MAIVHNGPVCRHGLLRYLFTVAIQQSNAHIPTLSFPYLISLLVLTVPSHLAFPGLSGVPTATAPTSETT